MNKKTEGRKDILTLYYTGDGEDIEIDQKVTTFNFTERKRLIDVLLQIVTQMMNKDIEEAYLLKEGIVDAERRIANGEVDEEDVDPHTMLTLLKRIVE